MQTINDFFRKVHDYIHFKGWLTQFERECNILDIFHYFQYFERFGRMKKWQISKPKIVDRYLDFSKESYTTLKNVISSFKICFQNYGQLIRKFLRPTGMARAPGTDTLRSSSELFFTRHLPEFIGNMPTPTTTRAFVKYLSFFQEKVRVNRFSQNHLA